MYKISFITILFFLFSAHCYCQANTRKYKAEVKKFIRYIRDEEFRPDTITTVNFLCNKKLINNGTIFSINSGDFTIAEKKDIIKHLTMDTSKYFVPQRLFKKALFLSEEQIQFSKKYIQFSKPFFLRNYTLCIFCYGGPDIERAYLLKKEKGKWEVIKKLGGIESY